MLGGAPIQTPAADAIGALERPGVATTACGQYQGRADSKILNLHGSTPGAWLHEPAGLRQHCDVQHVGCSAAALMAASVLVKSQSTGGCRGAGIVSQAHDFTTQCPTRCPWTRPLRAARHRGPPVPGSRGARLHFGATTYAQVRDRVLRCASCTRPGYAGDTVAIRCRASQAFVAFYACIASGGPPRPAGTGRRDRGPTGAPRWPGAPSRVWESAWRPFLNRLNTVLRSIFH